MNFLKDFFKGCIVGVANIIPGVSGGTLALTLGIYNKMLGSISNLFKNFRKSIQTLFPILLGCAAGIAAFSFIIPYLIEHFPFPTVMAFIGLILGGVPMLFREYQKAHSAKASGTVFNAALFLFFFVGSIFLATLNETESGQALTADIPTIVTLFFVGILAAATMIIPGVSGSLVMMILGFYFGIVGAVKDFLTALKSFDIGQMLELCKLLIPFGVGVLLGLFYVAKVIEWLIKKHAAPTYSAIIGLVLASPVTIFLKTGFTAESFILVPVICGVVLLTALFIVSYRFSKSE